MMILVSWSFRSFRPLKVDKWFRRWQLVSAGAYSLGHGGNDAQKTIGIIWMLLIAAGYTNAADQTPPNWVIRLLFGNWPGHHVWWLAHCENHGAENNETQTGGWFLC